MKCPISPSYCIYLFDYSFLKEFLLFNKSFLESCVKFYAIWSNEHRMKTKGKTN